MKGPWLAVTRIVNACALIEINGEAVLTDPYFDKRWFMRLREPIGMKVAELPKLAAILGGHGVSDHWQPEALSGYPFKDTTPVYVATQGMLKKAKSAGFKLVEVLDWNETRRISEQLTIEVASSQIVAGHKPNSYVLNSGGLCVFVGTEARDMEPVKQCRLTQGRIDVALLPIDGSALFGRKLVMGPSDAIEAALILGAHVLIPIHYALKPISVLLQTPGSVEDLLDAKAHAKDLEIVVLRTGERWMWSGRAAVNGSKELESHA